jgi:hypothetical protein
VSGSNLATPDARHRRTLKFFSENHGAKFLKNTAFMELESAIRGASHALHEN